MKLATFRVAASERIGIVDVERGAVFDLKTAAGRAGIATDAFASMLALIDADDAGLDQARDLIDTRGSEDDLWHSLASLSLAAPLPEPRQMRDGMSYETHIRQSGRGARAILARNTGGDAAFAEIMAAPTDPLPEIYRQVPIYYITNRNTVVGPEAIVAWPRYSKLMDYELETAVVTKRTKANIKASDAPSHIFGYTIFNDFSARDRQMIEMQGRLGPAKGKSFDSSNAMGPWIVTPDEMTDIQSLSVAVRVNGEVRATGSTAGMLFSFEEIIADASQDETIRAGEVFGSGTVGNCCGLETGKLLQHDDVIELDVERIGVLRNRVVRQD